MVIFAVDTNLSAFFENKSSLMKSFKRHRLALILQVLLALLMGPLGEPMIAKN
jgi:hypothetical protein